MRARACVCLMCVREGKRVGKVREVGWERKASTSSCDIEVFCIICVAWWDGCHKFRGNS